MKTILLPLRRQSPLRQAARGLILLGLVAGTGNLRAADIYKADNSENLNLGLSWTNGAPPTSSDVAVWDATVTAANTALLGADTNWAGIRIESPGGAAQISAGNTLTLGAAGIDTSLASQPLTLACPVVVGAPQSWNLVTAVTVSGVISGTAGNGITNIGTGQINISGANNSFLDGITVNSGIVNVTAGSAMPVRLNGGQLTVGGAIWNPVDVLPAGGTIRISANRTLSGNFTGTGTATVSTTSSMLSLGGNILTNFYGTLSLGGSSGGLRANSSAFAGSTNTTFDLGSSAGYWTRTTSAGTVNLGALTGGASTQLRSGGTETYLIGGKNLDTTFSGAILNGSPIVKVGAGTLVLDGANTYTGSTTISNGLLQIGNGGTSGQLGAGNVTNYTALVFNRDGNLTVSALITGAGAVTNMGPGTVTLTGANTYSGQTCVTAGKLLIGTASAVTSAYTVSDYAGLGVAVASSGAMLTQGSAGFGANCSYDFNLGTFGNPTGTVVTNTGAVTLSGDVAVNLSGTNFSLGTITLLRYASRSGAGNFVLGTVPGYIGATLNDDTVNKELKLTITSISIGVDMTFKYVGDASGIWDIDNAANPIWKVVGNGQITNYTEGAAVLFDDTATGTTNIDLTTTVNPGAVTVNNTNKTYTFGGAGALSGSTGLTKKGPGTLVITNASSYSGLTAIEAGKIIVAEETGALGSGGVTNNGSLVIDKTAATNAMPYTLQFTGEITGAGSVTFLGVDQTNSTLQMEISTAAGNPFSGGAVISNGYVRLNPNPSSDATRSAAKSTGFGTGTLTFLGNSTLQLADYGVGNSSAQWGGFACPIHVPAGQTGSLLTAGRMTVSGALTGGGTFNLVVSYVRDVISGDFSAFTGQMNVTPSPNATGNQYQVGNAAGLPLARVRLAAGVTMGGNSPLANNSIVPIGELSADEGSYIATVGEASRAAIFSVGGLNTSSTFAGCILAHSLTKVGTGVLTLSGTNNTYTGATTISNGVLALITNSLGGNTEISNTATISISAPGVLDVSGQTDGIFPLGAAASQTLRGNGTIRGSLAVGALGTVTPGFSIGTLTVTNAVSLGGAVVMELNRAGSPNSDRIVSPSITAGGTLTVTNIGAGLQTGDTFQLFSTPVAGAFAVLNLQTNDTVNQLLYSWNNRLAIDGTLVVTATPAINPNPPTVLFEVGGGGLNLSWPTNLGWILQTNSVSVVDAGAWFPYPGSASVTNVTVAIDPNKANVFFRMIKP